MATQNNTISPVPNNQPVIDKNTLKITQVWSSFFSDLFMRIGGPTAASNLTLQQSIASINAINQLTGDVDGGPASGIGSVTTTIQPGVVSNSKLSNMPGQTIKGNNAVGSAAPQDLTPAQVQAMLPNQFSFHSGPLSNTASILLTSASYTNFSNSPTLTFTPTISGTYKVYASLPLLVTNATDSAQARIFASSGAPTLVAQSVGNLSGAASIQSNQYVMSVYTLTAGDSYSFDVQGQCSSVAGCQVPAIGYYIFAERVA